MIDHSLEVHKAVFDVCGNGNLNFPFFSGADGDKVNELYAYLRSVSVVANNCTGEDGNVVDVVVTIVQDFPNRRYSWLGIRQAARDITKAISSLENGILYDNVRASIIDITSSNEREVEFNGLFRLVKDIRFQINTKEKKPIS